MWDVVTSSGEIAELQPHEYPYISEGIGEPTLAIKCHKNAKNVFWFVHSGLLNKYSNASWQTLWKRTHSQGPF